MDPQDENKPADASLYNQGDAAAPHRQVVLHGLRGLRLAVDVDAGTLELWLSPQSGPMDDFELKNFSNRDDHTRIFDLLRLGGVRPADFRGCSYDPVHTVLDYGANRLHLAQHPGHSAVMLWFDAGGRVELKTDKQDEVPQRGPRLLAALHPDRGHLLAFAAAIGAGTGAFWHAPVLVPRRSVWARADLAPGQALVLAGELAHLPVADGAARLAALGGAAFAAEAEAAFAVEAGTGRLSAGPAWRDPAQLERLVQGNRRLLLASQDASGALRDGPKFIYSLLWVRAGMNTPLAAWAGLPGLLRRWLPFALAHPTRSGADTLYGQLFGEHTKHEEDGLFYVVWAAHTAWARGDGAFLQDGHLRTLLAALDWLDRACWDEERGLYGRFYACESPFAGHRDDGWDPANGAPADWPAPRWQGRTPVRAYDTYINLLQYAVLRMLAPHADAGRRAALLARAARIDAALAPLWRGDGLPPYGRVRFADGGEELLPAFGLDHCDYVWSLTMPPFAPPAMPVQRIRATLARHVSETLAAGGRLAPFLFAHTWPLLAADPAWRDPAATVADLERFLPEIARPGRYQPSAGTVMECIGVPDGHPWHDVRPCAFANAQWLPTAYALGLRREAHGWSLRGTDALRRLAGFDLGHGCRADLEFTGGAPLAGIAIDGRALHHTLQLPESALTQGCIRIVVGGPPAPGPLLLGTEARLLAVERRGDAVVYRLAGHGPHRLRFADGERLVELDGEGELAVPG